MVRVESGCVDCGLPCVHEACPHYKVVIYECDSCGNEDELFHYEGEELCVDCIKRRLERVEYNE